MNVRAELTINSNLSAESTYRDNLKTGILRPKPTKTPKLPVCLVKRG
jgi:hypothetical protein